MIFYKDYIEKDPLFLQLYESGRKNKKTYCDNIFCFDIETCNFFVENGKALSINDVMERNNFDYSKIESDFDNLESGAVCYIWMFGAGEYVIYGRTLDEFIIFFEWFKNKLNGVYSYIYVHNLSFEYSFLKEYLNFDEKFFTETQKPLFLRCNNIEWRCSYRLTNLSLERWGQNCGVEKKVGQLDYHGLFTPITQLSEKEMEYCFFDIEIMKKGLAIYKATYKHIKDIPLTQTGIPRREIKKLNAKNKSFLFKCAKCQPDSVEAWLVQHITYSGGLTLCNPAFAGRVLKNVSTFDRSSAYPSVMLYDYPSSGFSKIDNKVNWNDGNAHICLVEFFNFNAKYKITPQSASKKILIQGVTYGFDALEKNNGKVIHADRFALYVTEVDFEMLSKFYNWDRMIIHSHWIAEKDPMPKHIIEYMLQLYSDKTTLKNVIGQETNYLRKKEILNSLYGMAATALCHDEIVETEDFTFEKKALNNLQMAEQLLKFKKNIKRNILPYSWGLYITAYQRRDLMDTVLELGVDNTVYMDTDSCKGLYNDGDFLKIKSKNEKIIEWTKKRCELQGIDFNLTQPKDKKGVVHPLGIWELEGCYFESKFLGAKRYAYKESESDHVHITIAGVPKSAWNVLQSVDDLKEGLTFDIFNSRKNLITYKDGKRPNPQAVFPDGFVNSNKYGAVIRPTSYKLTLTEDYRELIEAYLNKKINL